MAAKKIKLNKLDPKTQKVFSESEVGVLLEHLDGNIKLFAEAMGGRMDCLDGRMDCLDGRIESLEKEMRQGFGEINGQLKTIFDYLLRIDDELQGIKRELKNKTDKKDFTILESRVSRLESDLETCKKMIVAAKN